MRVLASSLCLCAVCHAATITVDLNGGEDYTEIQPAIDAAADGDTVLVRQGAGGTTEGAPETDFDGQIRPCGDTTDIGAYEAGACGPPPVRFRRGDANTDDRVNIADAIATLTFLFGGEAVVTCLDAVDANDDGTVNIADAIAVLSHLFGGAGPLPQPFGECGIDPTLDELGCESFNHCS